MARVTSERNEGARLLSKHRVRRWASLILLGADVLYRFGTITVDYAGSQLILDG